jgi:hypothetical protein
MFQDKIYKFINYFVDSIFFLKDLFFFKLLKKNSSRSYKMMLRLFYLTGGFSNDVINFFVSKKPLNNNSNEGILKKYNHEDLINKYEDLKKNGYVIFEDILNQNQIESLTNDLKKKEGFYVSDEVIKSQKEILDINNPKAVKFYYKPKDLINNILFQKILFDTSLINFAQLYLKSYPVIDNITSWWSFPSAAPDKNAAQWWHFDLERPKWLKFFFFLTDCNSENGAH